MFDQALEWAVIALPTLFAVGLELISDGIRSDKRWRWGVTLFGIGISVLTGLQISRSNNEHGAQLKRSERAQEELKEKLDQSLLDQQYTKGQLSSLALMVGRLGQPGPENKELAAAIRQMAQANAQRKSDLESSNSDLCKRAHAEAVGIRLFQVKFDNAERAMEEDWIYQAELKTTQERRDAWRASEKNWMSANETHKNEFQTRYVADAKYLRDLLMNRVSPEDAEVLRGKNREADDALSMASLSGAYPEYRIANYLDELASAICPLTSEQKQAKIVSNRAMAKRLAEFRVMGNKLQERCYQKSIAAPTSSEVDRWIAGADAYVRGTGLDEDLKTQFMNEGAGWNATYINVAPTCANLMGKLIVKTSEIASLEVYLKNQ